MSSDLIVMLNKKIEYFCLTKLEQLRYIYSYEIYRMRFKLFCYINF